MFTPVITCVQCNTDHVLPVMTEEEVDRFNDGLLIQNVVPFWTDDQRESLILRMCEPCVRTLYADLDEDCAACGNCSGCAEGY